VLRLARLFGAARGCFSLHETEGTVSSFDELTGLLLDVTDRNGHKVTLTYDLVGRLESLTHSNGERFDFGYNGAGRLIQLTDQAEWVGDHDPAPAGIRKFWAIAIVRKLDLSHSTIDKLPQRVQERRPLQSSLSSCNLPAS